MKPAVPDPVEPKDPGVPPSQTTALDATIAAVQQEAGRRTAEAALAGVVRAVGSAADSALDAVETLIFGKVGGAAEAVRKDAASGALDRLRETPPDGAPIPPGPPEIDPVERARQQLEALKRQRDLGTVERKKTM